MKCEAVLLAGGKGLRLGGSIPKQYLLLNGEMIALFSFRILLQSPSVSKIVVVAEEPYQKFFVSNSKEIAYALPGVRRQDSLSHGLKMISADCTHVLVHDAARPFITELLVEETIKEGFRAGAATLGVQVKATIKQANESKIVERTLDRSQLYEIQTPQVVLLDWITEGLKKADREGLTITDDVGLAELMNHQVQIVLGSSENFKITTPEDLRLADAMLEVKSGAL